MGRGECGGTPPQLVINRSPFLEVHIPDFSGDLYGQYVVVYFHAFIRPERKFSSLEALKEQLKEDKKQAKKMAVQWGFMPVKG